MKFKYYHIKYYNQKLEDLKRLKQDFKIVKTGYTKRIVTSTENIFFNDAGDDDKKLLLLISAVRNDAKKYLERYGNFDFTSKDTDFFNLLDVINDKKIIVKIDLKSAYWEYAIKKEIISKDTNNKFLEWYSRTDSHFSKQARLKALGSLATSKLTDLYINGKYFKSEEPETQATKSIYMLICDGIDKLMKDCNYYNDGCVYYYWDCIFVDLENKDNVLNYLKNRGFNVTTEEAKIEFFKIGDIGYIVSTIGKDRKTYMTKKENKHLLDYDY